MLLFFLIYKVLRASDRINQLIYFTAGLANMSGMPSAVHILCFGFLVIKGTTVQIGSGAHQTSYVMGTWG
jgi:hypothetical protein